MIKNKKAININQLIELESY